MRNVLKALSLIMIIAFSIALVPTQKAYADSGLYAIPSDVTTNSETTKVTLPTLDSDCYVLYTSVQDQDPDQSEMWRIPAGQPNVQDFNIPGTWWLHVYVPDTGERATFGPYQKEAVAPPIPFIQINTNITTGQLNTNVSEVNLQVCSKGDDGESGHDNINDCDSYFASGFDHLEVWDNNTQLDISQGEETGTFTITGDGWHKIWARAVDKVGNVSDWSIVDFGLGSGTDPGTGDPGGSGSGSGAIKFNPNEASWTNSGKTSEGHGKFPIEVSFTGTNPYKGNGSATVEVEHHKTDHDGHTSTYYTHTNKSFTVSWPFNKIEVSGATNATINGTSGTVNIEQEGEGLQLYGEGSWGEASYSLPSNTTSYNLPSDPPNPTATSGLYNIDWTKPEFDVTEHEHEWHNDDPTYDVSVDIGDELSGIKSGKITVNDSSHYGHDKTINVTGGSKSFSKTINLDDGIYSIKVDTKDVATNERNETYETYYEDHSKPKIDFNIKNKIFSEDNGAIKKASILGSDESFYGTLTASDNLSGIKSISYKWTYGDNGDVYPENEYTNIYSNEDTFSDRHDETITKEIEKPVGDNLYMHVKTYDEAGNYTYECYGPYEDPIKLKEFEVTDIRDPRWDEVFWKDPVTGGFTQPTGVKYGVNKLPIDELSHPTVRNCWPKKGYAFYWDITSEYLYRQNDRIEVKPTFYYLINGNRIRVDAYYNNNNNPLVLFGREDDDSKINLDTDKYGKVLIGNYNKLILTRGVRIPKGREWLDSEALNNDGWQNEIQYNDGKTQWFYGKYYIPATTIFFPAGQKPLPQNQLKDGKVLINFEIIAYKNGVETLSTSQIFNYTTQQWEKEGGPKTVDGDYTGLNYKEPYCIGDTIIYDAKYSALSDHEVRVIQ